MGLDTNPYQMTVVFKTASKPSRLSVRCFITYFCFTMNYKQKYLQINKCHFSTIVNFNTLCRLF